VKLFVLSKVPMSIEILANGIMLGESKALKSTALTFVLRFPVGAISLVAINTRGKLAYLGTVYC